MIQENANTEEAGTVLMWQIKEADQVVAGRSVLWSKKNSSDRATSHGSPCESKLGYVPLT